MVNEPLVFDYNFLKELKEKYSILIKKYVGMMVFSLFLVFSGIILLNMVNGNWADGVFIGLNEYCENGRAEKAYATIKKQDSLWYII